MRHQRSVQALTSLSESCHTERRKSGVNSPASHEREGLAGDLGGGGSQPSHESACVIRPLNQWKVGPAWPDLATPPGLGNSGLGVQQPDSISSTQRRQEEPSQLLSLKCTSVSWGMEQSKFGIMP